MNEAGKLDTTATDGVYQGARPASRIEPAATPNALALARQFPPREPGADWSATRQSRARIAIWLLGEPATDDSTRRRLAGQRRHLGWVLDWLERQPGESWQDRWLASGAETEGNIGWRRLPIAGSGPGGPTGTEHCQLGLARALSLLVVADVIRPGLCWLLSPATPRDLAAAIAQARDPDGFARLTALCRGAGVATRTAELALRRIAVILAAKGGLVAEITIGDCLQLIRLIDKQQPTAQAARSPYFYQLLRGAGVFGDQAPTARGLRTQGQLDCEQLIDRYRIQCQPVRDLLVDYLRERRTGLDYASLHKLSYVLGRLFWRDLELHHPGIASLRLSAEIAAGWKQRVASKTIRTTVDGQPSTRQVSRVNAADNLMTVRAFYLDLSQWAADDPARWGPWVVPCPIRETDVSMQKN